jgi:sirohydrochlorin cobaltochelatase
MSSSMSASMSTPTSASTSGLLLLAHGARDPAWALPFEAVAERIRAAQPGLKVSLAFLEFMSPGIVAGGRTMALDGCKHIDLVPLFLGAGGHVRKDLPVFVEQLRTEFPAVAWRLQPAIGEVRSVIEAMADAAIAMLSSPDLPSLVLSQPKRP